MNTMPTKPAVNKDTPIDRGPTSFSCSIVLRTWIFPADKRQTVFGVCQGNMCQATALSSMKESMYDIELVHWPFPSRTAEGISCCC